MSEGGQKTEVRRRKEGGALLVMVLTGLSLAACPSSTTTSADYRRHSDPTATVDSPRVEAGAAGDDLEVRTHWTADAISSATPVMAAPDAYTRATEFSQTRHEAGVAANFERGDTGVLSGSLTMSRQTDYAGHAASASAAREFLDRRLTLSTTGRTGFDRVRSADDPGFAESLWTAGLAAEATYVMRPSLVGHVTWDMERASGYQHNPYRMVPVFDAGAGYPTVVVAERHPDQRRRYAVEPAAIWSPDGAWFLQGRYRLYADDWGVRSHTAGADLWKVWWDDRLRGRLRLRAYTQGDADFYRARYDDVTAFRSGDYRLSRMGSVATGLRVDFRPSPLGERRLRFSAVYDVTHYRFANYAPRRSMNARSLGLSIGMEWER